MHVKDKNFDGTKMWRILLYFEMKPRRWNNTFDSLIAQLVTFVYVSQFSTTKYELVENAKGSSRV